MSITSYTDIVIAICILVSVLVGYHRGFLVTIARIVAMVASYIGAILAAEMLKKTLAQTLFVPMIRQGLGNGAFADLAQEALLQTAEGIAYSVVFFVVFALLQFVLLRAIHVLKLVDHIPVLGTMNKLAGGVLGFSGYSFSVSCLAECFLHMCRIRCAASGALPARRCSRLYY